MAIALSSIMKGCVVENGVSHYVLPGDVGVGNYRIWPLRNGLTLAMIQARFHETVTFHNDLSRPGYELIFWMSGESSVNEHFEKDLRLSPGFSHMAYLSFYSGHIRLEGGRPVQLIQVDIAPEEFAKILGKDYEQFIVTMLDGQTFDPGLNTFLGQSPYPPAIQGLLDDIWNHPFAGDLERLYLEGKTLELIAHHIQWKRESQQGIKNGLLSRRDVEKLHTARTILLGSLTDPPGIQELARKTGLNEFKLKKGFKQLFDSTVYEMVRKERMLMAGDLLSSCHKNITEVAVEVGYSNMSHFATAFRKQFGINPAEFLKRCRLASTERKTFL